MKKGHSAIARCQIDCDDIEVYEIKDGKPSKNWEVAKLARYLRPGTQWKLVPFDFMETNFKLTSNSFFAENLCEQIKVKGKDKRGKVILIEYREYLKRFEALEKKIQAEKKPLNPPPISQFLVPPVQQGNNKDVKQDPVQNEPITNTNQLVKEPAKITESNLIKNKTPEIVVEDLKNSVVTDLVPQQSVVGTSGVIEHQPWNVVNETHELSKIDSVDNNPKKIESISNLSRNSILLEQKEQTPMINEEQPTHLNQEMRIPPPLEDEERTSPIKSNEKNENRKNELDTSVTSVVQTSPIKSPLKLSQQQQQLKQSDEEVIVPNLNESHHSSINQESLRKSIESRSQINSPSEIENRSQINSPSELKSRSQIEPEDPEKLAPQQSIDNLAKGLEPQSEFELVEERGVGLPPPRDELTGSINQTPYNDDPEQNLSTSRIKSPGQSPRDIHQEEEGEVEGEEGEEELTGSLRESQRSLYESRDNLLL